jgi:hypothetical protein
MCRGLGQTLAVSNQLSAVSKNLDDAVVSDPAKVPWSGRMVLVRTFSVLIHWFR